MKQKTLEDYAERTRRAREDVEQVVQSGRIWLVEGEENAVYHVDPDEGTCDCPDHLYRDKRCKHIRAVELARDETDE